MLYRWILAAYFLGWFVVIIIKMLNYIKWKYLIYVSNWAYMVWLAYLIFSAVSVTLKFSWQLLVQRRTICELNNSSQKCQICQNTVCDMKECPRTNWCASTILKIQWLLFTVGTEFAVAITLLYWTLFYDPHSEQNFFSVDSLHIHLINGILALFDLWICAVPVRLYHCLYSVIFAAIYLFFTGIYYAAGGTDPSGNHCIYPFLNYAHNPMPAVGIGIFCALLLMVAIHFLFFLQFIIRNWITCKIQRNFHHRRESLVYNPLPLSSSSSELTI